MTNLQTMPSPGRTEVPDTFEPITTASEQQAEERKATWRAPGPVARVVGIAGAIGVLIGAVNLMGGHPSEYLQITAHLIVLGMAVFGLIASHGVHAFGRLMATACGSPLRSESEAEQLRSMCDRGRRLCYSGGVLAALFGIIHVLSVLDRPALIGPGLAVALVGLVLAAVFAELGFGAVKHWLRVPA